MAPALRVVAVVAELLVGLALAAQLRQLALVLLPELRLAVAVVRPVAHLAHKLLPLLLVAVVRPVALPQEAEVEVVVPLWLVQGLVASEILRSR